MKFPNVLLTIKPVPHGPGIPVSEVTGDISEIKFSSSTAVVLNLFRAVAYFKGPLIFVTHLNKNFDVMITMLLG